MNTSKHPSLSRDCTFYRDLKWAALEMSFFIVSICSWREFSWSRTRLKVKYEPSRGRLLPSTYSRGSKIIGLCFLIHDHLNIHFSEVSFSCVFMFYSGHNVPANVTSLNQWLIPTLNMPLACSFPEISVRSRQQTYKESPAAFEINDKVSTRSKRGERIWEYLIPFMVVNCCFHNR